MVGYPVGRRLPVGGVRQEGASRSARSAGQDHLSEDLPELGDGQDALLCGGPGVFPGEGERTHDFACTALRLLPRLQELSRRIHLGSQPDDCRIDTQPPAPDHLHRKGPDLAPVAPR